MAAYIDIHDVIETIRYSVCQGQGNKEHICQRGSCAYCGIMEIMSDISALPAVDVQPADRWISVDEALPEKDGYYLVVKECEICEGIDIAEYSENRWHKHDRVIYWQPLPDLPEAIKG